MALTKDSDMVKAVASDRSNDAAYPWLNWPVANAHRTNSLSEGLAVDAIPIPDDIARCISPTECLSHVDARHLGTAVGLGKPCLRLHPVVCFQ